MSKTLLQSQWSRVLLILALTALLSTWLYLSREQVQPARLPPPFVRVISSPVQRLDVQPLRRITGQLQAARKTTLAFEISGKVVRRVHEPGQTVAAGELLLQLEAEDYEDALRARRVERDMERTASERDRQLLKLLNEELQLQQLQLQRMATLERQSLASQSAHDNAKQSLLRLQGEQTRLQHQVDSAATRLQKEEAEYQLAERRLVRTRLTAPYAGMVSAMHAEVGDYVTVGQAAAELIQIDQLDLLLAIPAELLPGLHQGQSITLAVDDRQLQGHCVAIGLEPNPRTHTHPLRIRVPGEGLYPGQLATAILPGAFSPQALVVPLSAVLHEEGGTFVYRVRDGRLDRLPIQLLQRYQNLYVVAGLTEGEQIVTHDVGSLADGQRVQTMQSAQDSFPGQE